MANISTAFKTEGFVKQRKDLEALLMKNPAMEKKVHGLIRKVLAEARKSMTAEARQVMDSDPRHASRAIRTMVYKRILGGNINILRKKRAGNGGGSYTPTRTLRTGQRGGNRRDRSDRTKNLESYYGSDRGFVLRFLNSGTNDRFVPFRADEAREHVRRGSRGGNIAKYGKTINTGRRGHIAARDWFGNRGQKELDNAADNLGKLIDEMIETELK